MRIEISGATVSVRISSVSIDDRIEERTIAHFTVIDLAGAENFDKGEPVEIYDETDTSIWTGFIDRAERHSIGGVGSGFFWSMTAVDNHYLADKRILVAAYTDMKAGDIVRDIVDTLLSQEGIVYDTGDPFQIPPDIIEASGSLRANLDLTGDADVLTDGILIEDTFADTNGTTLANHVATGINGGFAWIPVTNNAGLTIQNNQLVSTGSGALTELRADRDLGVPDQSVQVTVEDWTGQVDGGTVDPFGVLEVYPTVAGGQEWDSGHWANAVPRVIAGGATDPDDPTSWSQASGLSSVSIDGAGVMAVGDAVPGLTGNAPRFYINPDLDGDPLFRNTEVTLYYRRVSDDGLVNGGAVIGVRSDPNAPHSGTTNCVHVYYAGLHNGGDAIFTKELLHPATGNGASQPVFDNGFPFNQWIGLKFVTYDVGNTVKLELYRDMTGGLNGGVWEKILEQTDNGNPVWTTSTPCPAILNSVILQDGFIILRNDGVHHAEYKWVSVREIDPAPLTSSIARIGLIARTDPANEDTFYLADLRIQDGRHELAIISSIDDVERTVAAADLLWDPGDTLKFEVEHAIIRAYRNDDLLLTIQEDEDIAILSGNYVGIRRDANSSSVSLTVDNYQAHGIGLPSFPNLAVDGSFEIVGIPDWTQFITPGLTATTARSTVEALDGVASLEINVTGSTNAGVAKRFQIIPASPGDVFNVSLMAKLIATHVGLAIVWRDSQNNVISEVQTIYTHHPTPTVMSLQLSRFAPTVHTTGLVIPGLRNLSLTRFAPTVGPILGPPITKHVRVTASADDAEENSAGGVNLTSTDLELGFDTTTDQIVGCVFRDCNLPAGAIIQAAMVTFTVDQPTISGTVTVTIRVEESGSPSSYTTGTNNIIGRSYTTNKTVWTIPAFVNANDEHQSADFSAALQEAIDTVGAMIDIAVIFDGITGLTNTTPRRAESYDGNPSSAPLLSVTYVPATPGFITGRMASLAVTTFAPSVSTTDVPVAFPGAEGAGALALTTSRSLPVLVHQVTNTNGSGTGSLRQAILNCQSNRYNIIIFRSGGTIDLGVGIDINTANIYIAGQTAPGGGIQLRGTPALRINRSGNANNIVIRYLRTRSPKGTAGQADVLSVDGGHDIVLDHISAQWGNDEILSITPVTLVNGGTSPHDITVQRCIIAEGLRPHSTGSIIGDNDNELTGGNPTPDTYNITMHHNLYAHNAHRNPNINALNVKIINNVTYNWANYVTQTGKAAEVDLINNHHTKGPWSSTSVQSWYSHESCPGTGTPIFPITPSLYISGNIFNAVGENRTTPNSDQWSFERQHYTCQTTYTAGTELPAGWQRGTPLADPDVPVTIQPAIDARDSVLNDVGAHQRLAADGTWVDMQDQIDADIITDYLTGDGPSTDTEIDDPADFGGFPTLDPGTPPANTLGDGIPDAWRTRFYGGPTAGPAFDAVAAGGYLLIEHYLNGTDPT